MAALATVSDYIAEARVLLLDKVAPYRYSDDELTSSLNIGLLEMRKLRPDLFLATSGDVPSYSAGNQAVALEQMYRPALAIYIAGRSHLRDEETTQDSRAAGFMSRFTAQLMSLSA